MNCPKTGKPMIRDTRPMEISHKGRSITVSMPGWYCHESGESIHTGEDMKVSDAALERKMPLWNGPIPDKSTTESRAKYQALDARGKLLADLRALSKGTIYLTPSVDFAKLCL